MRTARDIALWALVRVERDGAFASAALASAFSRRPGIDPRDRGLATELTMGVLRWRGALDAALEACAPRGIRRLDVSVLSALRIAAYQIAHLDRIPTAAAISAAVDQVRAARGDRMASFASGILRAIERNEHGAMALARDLERSHPPWLIDILRRQLPEDEVVLALAANNRPPPTCLRINVRRATPEVVADRLSAASAGVTASAGRHVSTCLRVDGLGDPAASDPFRLGWYSVQDEGAQIVVAVCVEALCGKMSACGPRPDCRELARATERADADSLRRRERPAAEGAPGDFTRAVRDTGGAGRAPVATERCGVGAHGNVSPTHSAKGLRVLDACAGRGGKTAALAEALEAGCTIDAADRSPAKLARLAADFARLGLPPARLFAVDLEVGTGELEPGYDLVLLDAPCSGTGVVRRRPEVRWRRSAADVTRMAAVQAVLLERVASLVEPGGTLVYSVCSIAEEEGPAVVRRAPASLRLVSERILWPHRDDTDGFFIAVLEDARTS